MLIPSPVDLKDPLMKSDYPGYDTELYLMCGACLGDMYSVGKPFFPIIPWFILICWKYIVVV